MKQVRDPRPREDGEGYSVRETDLSFLGISDADLAALERHEIPLGMTPSQFTHFIDDLKTSLLADKVTYVDVRLQGSAAFLFSGAHKPMVYDWFELFDEFRTGRGRIPEAFEFAEIFDQVNSLWPLGTLRPERRMFDSMFRLGLTSEPSDYDVQISSDQIYVRAKDEIRRRVASRAPKEDLKRIEERCRVESPTYSFIEKDLVDTVCPNLMLWRFRQTNILGRGVTVAAFPAEGPRQTEGLLSSHFRETDWSIEPQNAFIP